MWYVYYVQSSKYNLNVNITFKYLKLICIATVQLHMLLKVTDYEQQDLFDPQGVELKDGQTISTVEGKKKL